MLAIIRASLTLRSKFSCQPLRTRSGPLSKTFLSDSYFFYNYLDYHYFVILFVSQVVFSELFCTDITCEVCPVCLYIPNKDVNMPSSQPNHGHIGLQIHTPRTNSILRHTGFKVEVIDISNSISYVDSLMPDSSCATNPKELLSQYCMTKFSDQLLRRAFKGA